MVVSHFVGSVQVFSILLLFSFLNQDIPCAVKNPSFGCLIQCDNETGRRNFLVSSPTFSTQTNNTKKISSSILVVSDYYHTNNNEVLIQLSCSCSCRILPCVSICADIWRKLIRYSVEQGRVQLLRDLITQNTVDKKI